jgi:hypothetical protein
MIIFLGSTPPMHENRPGPTTSTNCAASAGTSPMAMTSGHYEPRTAGSQELPWQQLVTMVIGGLQSSTTRLRVASVLIHRCGSAL